MQARADVQGRICADKGKVLDEMKLFKLLTLEEGYLYQPKQFVDDYIHMQYLRGNNISPNYALCPQTGSTVIDVWLIGCREKQLDKLTLPNMADLFL